ncbi:MAG: penicillin-binding protein 2 [Candidatus Sungbacteria bacterium]|nr:penicillin-binding protein 2 [Candidatus Sungbacteria bacterium]
MMIPRRSRMVGLIDPEEILADSASVFRGEELEGKLERPISRAASFAFLGLVVFGMGYLLWRAGSLQIASGEEFFVQAQKNRFLARPIYPGRGILYDRFRTPLVQNVPSFGVSFVKNEFLKSGKTLDEVLDPLSRILQKEYDFFFEAGFPADFDPARLPGRLSIVRDVPIATLLVIASRDLPGVEIVEGHRRAYRDPFAFSHALGSVGKISLKDLAARPELAQEETVGKNGIEARYDAVLRGRGGRKIIEADSQGRETRFRFTEEPREGAPLLLSLDGGLQEAAYRVVDGYVGAAKGASVVALDPRTGAVRALLSYPGFDINAFSSSLSKKEFEAITADPLTPLFNRAIAGEFPSGSTIKPLIGAAALQEGIIDPKKRIFDEGFIAIENPFDPEKPSIFKDWRRHGWVDFYDAIALSANVYFYTVGGGYRDQEGLGIERIKAYLSRFGLGERLGIDMPGERSGFIPDPESKRTAEPKNPVWRVGDTYNVSIGQGGLLVTPLQIAAADAAIANGGTLYQPYIMEAVLDREGEVVQKTEPRIIRDRVVGRDVLQEVVKGMRQAVTAGTAGRLAGLPVAVAAKTGTAQAGSGKPHAWVSAHAPLENPEIAIVVMVEHAGEGSTVAVPIMHDILQWYFSRYPQQGS